MIVRINHVWEMSQFHLQHSPWNYLPLRGCSVSGFAILIFQSIARGKKFTCLILIILDWVM